MSEHICELTAIDSETWETTIGVEVVRCRDCRHMEQRTFNDPITDTDFRCFRCDYFNCPTRRDGFCAWGSRK